MALESHDDSSSSVNAARPAAPRMQMNQATTQAQPTRWSFHNAGAFQRGPIGRNISSEALAKLQKAMEDVFKASAVGYEVQLLALDNNNQQNLAFSCLVVCLKSKTEPELGVSYYPLLVEGSGEKIPARYETINGMQYEIVRVSSEAMDSVLMSEIHKKLVQMYPNQRLLPSDGCVIPAHFNPEDAKQLHAVAVSAGMACHTELMVRSPNFTDLRLTEQSRDSSLVVQPRYENKTIINAVGNPIRSDVQIAFTSQQASNGASKSINDSGRVVKVSQIDGFVDLVWAPTVETNSFGMYQQGMDPRTMHQKYAARFVMTQMVNEYMQTLPAYLMSLVTATMVREQNNWFNVFRPRATIPNSVDLHDIGAINIEAELPGTVNGANKILDTKASDFDTGKLASFISACIRPGLILSMDIEDAGPDTWCTSVFVAASDGEPKVSDAARNMIFNAAQHLTNGAFAEFFKSPQMFVDEGNRIHLGHYTDAQGNKRDIRDLDYLAILNLTGNQDIDVVKNYSNTYMRRDISVNQRLSDRKRILSGLVPGMEVTGFATRVTFSEAFISALVSGCAKAGLQMRPDLGNTGLQADTRSAFNGIAGALSGPAPSGLFTQQSVNTVGGGSFNNMFSRFGG